jgi:hypothetical protein
MSLVLVALHDGAALSKELAEQTMSLQVIDGQLDCKVAGYAATINAGQLVTISAGLPYHIIAKAESCFLLTMPGL